MRTFCLILLLTFSQWSHSADWLWEDGGSACGATFQACLNNATNGDTIYLKTNATLTADLDWSGMDKAVSLIAVDSFHPVIDAPTGITMEATEDLIIQGITLQQQGMVILKQASAFPESLIRLADNLINNQLTGSAIVVAHQDDVHQLNLEIINNRVNHQVAEQAAIVVSGASLLTDNDLYGLITGNQIQVSNASASGIELLAYNNAVYQMTVSGNRLVGATAGAIRFFNEMDNSLATVDIKNNVFLSLNSGQQPSGGVYVHADVEAPGFTTINFHNNTLNNAVNGLTIANPRAGNPVTLSLANNLMSDVETGLALLPREHMTLDMNERNFFRNIGTHVNFASGSGSNVVLPPAVRLTDHHGRLVADSVAIDAGVFVTSVPFIDADGQYRSKHGALDVGAFETGNHAFNHRVTSPGSHVSMLDDERLNTFSELEDLFITPMISLGNGLPGIHNYEHAGLYYNHTAEQWAVFNEGFTDLPHGTRFNVLKTGPSANTFEHSTIDSPYSFTRLNHAMLDHGPQKILLIAQHWSGVYNPHPVGIYYSEVFNDWYIYNLDGEPLPEGANFNVYVQDPSHSAWVHEVTEDSRYLYKTYLDNPLINGNKCVLMQVTQDASGGVFNDQPVGVEYDSGREQWAIVNISPATGAVEMPLGARFHVVVDPAQFADCDDIIFGSDFDPPDVSGDSLNE